MLRTHFVALLFFAIALRPCLGFDTQWRFDLHAATELASTNDRLLIVVQFDSDCLNGVSNSKELAFYQQAAISPSTQTWLQNHAELVAENIGQPSNLTFKNNQKNRSAPEPNSGSPAVPPARFSPSGNAITWLCQPEGVVLSCFVGFPEDHRFLKTIAKQANEVHQHSRAASNDPKRLRQWHLEQVQPADQKLYAEWLKKVPRVGKTTRERKLNAAVQALAETRAERIRQRFGSDWTEGQLLSLTHSFSQHASFEQPLIHLLLAEIPDIKLDELQNVLWSEVADVTFWKPDRRSLTTWLSKADNATKPVILRIPDSRQKLPRWPKSEQATELQEQFMVRPASLADVAFVARELNVGPLILSKRQTPTFFIADAKSGSWELLTRNDSKSMLTKQMNRISNLSKQGK